jgi:hypothetical protein
MRNRHRRISYLALVLLGVACWNARSNAQDSHYWNLRYGTRAEFLAGAVVGTPTGLSNSFYNPAGLSLLINPELFTTALSVEYSSVGLKPDRSDDSSLTWSTLGSSPSLVAGAFSHDSATGRTWTYSYLTRQKFEFELTGRAITEEDILPLPAGIESYSAELNFRQQAEEVWGGVSVARRSSSRFGYGVSIFGAYRSQRTRRQIFAAAVSDSAAGATVIDLTEYKLWTARLLAKAGVMWKGSSWSAGLAVTTPSLHLFGDGSAYFHSSLTGADVDSNGTEDARLAANEQQSLSPEYKSPWSVSVGAAYALSTTSFHLSAEWFDAVSRYTVMAGEPVPSQVPGDTQEVVLDHEAISVINAAIGIRQELTSKTTVYGGFSLDHSSYSGDRENSISLSAWDIYHVTFGSQFSLSSLQFTLGTTYSFGSEVVSTSAAFGEPNSGNSLEGEQIEGEASYRRLKLLLGFTLNVN